MITLYQEIDHVHIDLYNVLEVSGISISYRGYMHAETSLPDGWVLSANNNLIICINIGNNLPSTIFTYIGTIRILGATVFDRNNNIYPVNISKAKDDIWKNQNSKYEECEQRYTDFNFSFSTSDVVKNVSILTNNLSAGPDELYYKDGTPYEGKYHRHMDGLTMTGEYHSHESETIYPKDVNGNIVDFHEYRPKMLNKYINLHSRRLEEERDKIKSSGLGEGRATPWSGTISTGVTGGAGGGHGGGGGSY